MVWFNQDDETDLGNDTFFHGFACIEETFVLKLCGLRLEEEVWKTLRFFRGGSI
jgi:hypothetical protein